MIETHLNIFDAVVIGIMVLSCLFAFFRGLVREILSLVAWIGAAVVTGYYFKAVAEKIAPHFRDPHVATAIAVVGLYIAALVCFALINMAIVKTIKGGEGSGMLDNMLGLLFGAFRGAFIVSLGFFLITVVLPKEEYPKWITESITHPYVEKGAVILTMAAPEYLREISSLQKKAVGEIQKNERWDDDESDPDAGYNARSSQRLNRMTDSEEQER